MIGRDGALRRGISLEEQRYEKAALIRNLPNRTAIVKFADSTPALTMHTETVNRPTVPGLAIQAFNKAALDSSRYTRPVQRIEAELSDRRLALERRMSVETIEIEPERSQPRRRAIIAAT